MADPKELVSCNYPLYSAVDLGNGEIAVAGGGGKAKTGVPNGLVRFGQVLAVNRFASLLASICPVSVINSILHNVNGIW